MKKNNVVMMESLGNIRNASIIKLSLEELTNRLHRIYCSKAKIKNIINASYSCYNKDGLCITYDKFDNLFVIVNSNPNYSILTEKYVADIKTKDLIDILLLRIIKKIKNLVTIIKLMKTKLLILSVTLALIINTIFSVVTMWNTENYGLWSVLWIIAQVVIIVFSFYNINNKMSKGSRYKKRSNKYTNKTFKK